jgi:hypothetical protein
MAAGASARGTRLAALSHGYYNRHRSLHAERGMDMGKGISYFGLVAMGIGCMLGTSWLLLTGTWLETAGGPLNLVVAFALCIIIELPFAFAYMEAIPMLPLPGGEVVTGKTTDLMGASSATLLNALKRLAGIDHQHHLISREAIEPIQAVKVNHLGSVNPRLHSDETLIALAISATTNPLAKRALDQLSALRGCEAHSTVILSPVDSGTYSRLGLRLTCEPQYETNKLYHK